jgi:hypothetical protein
MMGYKLKRVDVKLEANEEKELCVVLAPEKRAAIHGVVKLPEGTPVKNALVKLFRKKGPDPCDLIPVTFAFTDECGQFLFGVDSCVDYVVKVFFYKPERVVPCDRKEEDC